MTALWTLCGFILTLLITVRLVGLEPNSANVITAVLSAVLLGAVVNLMYVTASARRLFRALSDPAAHDEIRGDTSPRPMRTPDPAPPGHDHVNHTDPGHPHCSPEQ